MTTTQIPPGQAVVLRDLLDGPVQGVSSRALARAPGGTLTLFAFDAGEELSEHSSPLEAFLIVLDGTFTVTVGGTSTRAPAGTLVYLPATVPHSLTADSAARMLLVMLRTGG
jgi:quercetin dioxygenase-like cupin family protein